MAARFDGPVPVLMYHALGDARALPRGREAEARYVVAAPAFERQMEALAAEGYQAIPLAALLADGPSIDVPRPLVVTFDDGWASDAGTARRVLDRLGWRSEHFITVGWVEQDRFMSWSDLGRLAESGQGIQSHSFTHPELDRLSEDGVRRELRASKETLELRLGRKVEFLALPGGRGGQTVPSIAAEVGYRGLCTSDVGLNRRGERPFAIRRIPIFSDTGTEQLLQWVRGVGLARIAFTRAAFRGIRRLAGRRLYEVVKARMLRARIGDPVAR